MNTSELIKERIKTVMINDRSKNIDSVIKILRSDEFTLLRDYFMLESEDMKISLEQKGEGYVLNISANINKILENGNLLDD